MTIDQSARPRLSEDAGRRRAPSGLVIEVGAHPRLGFRLVCLRGELDCATSSDLALVLSGVLGDGFVAAVIDLAELSFLDLTGARLIGAASVLFRRRGGEIMILSPNARIARTLGLIGLEPLIHDSGDWIHAG